MSDDQWLILGCIAVMGLCYFLENRDKRRWKQTADNLASMYLAQRIVNSRLSEDRDRYKRLATQVRAAEVMDEASARLRIVN